MPASRYAEDHRRRADECQPFAAIERVAARGELLSPAAMASTRWRMHCPPRSREPCSAWRPRDSARARCVHSAEVPAPYTPLLEHAEVASH